MQASCTPAQCTHEPVLGQNGLQAALCMALFCFLLNVCCGRLQFAACLLINPEHCTAIEDNTIKQHNIWPLQAEQGAAARALADNAVAARQAADAQWSWRDGSSASAAQVAQMLSSGSLQVC